LLEDVSTIVFAPSKAATCGSSDCAAAPMIQFGDQTRVSGRVLDGEGEPISDANVELFIEQPGVGLNDLNPTVGADGRWCAGVYPGTRVGVSAGRSSAGISVSASSVVQVAPFTHAACGGDCQVTPDLVLPRQGCITGTITDSSGYPLATGFMAVSTPDSKLVGTKVGTDGMGHYCLNAPRGTDLVFHAADNNRAYAEQILRLGKGAETSCKTGGCEVGPSLTLVDRTCLSGQVVDDMGVPTADAELRIYSWGPSGIESQATTPDPTGAFCAQVPAGAAQGRRVPRRRRLRGPLRRPRARGRAALPVSRPRRAGSAFGASRAAMAASGAQSPVRGIGVCGRRMIQRRRRIVWGHESRVPGTP